MSFTTRDLRCTGTPDALPPEAHYEVGVVYRVSEGPPDCPECGAPRVPFYATAEMEAEARYKAAGGVHTFREFLVDDDVRISSPEGLQRYKEHRAAILGVSPDAIQLTSRPAKNVTVDEVRHDAIVKRRMFHGHDERSWAEYRQECNRRTAERRTR